MQTGEGFIHDIFLISADVLIHEMVWECPLGQLVGDQFSPDWVII